MGAWGHYFSASPHHCNHHHSTQHSTNTTHQQPNNPPNTPVDSCSCSCPCCCHRCLSSTKNYPEMALHPDGLLLTHRLQLRLISASTLTFLTAFSGLSPRRCHRRHLASSWSDNSSGCLSIRHRSSRIALICC